MKKVVSVLLAVIAVCTITIGMTGCGVSKSAVVGVWHYVGEGDPWTANFASGKLYLYVYKDGTGDSYGKQENGNGQHVNSFEWRIEGEYFVRGTVKYTIEGDCMYDKQGKHVYTKISNDTSVDL